MSEVSVVIPVRNREADLLCCLAALVQQTYTQEKFEVIVCDDGSIKPLKAEKLTAQFPTLQLRVYHQSPQGPAAARNLGIRHARGSIIALTDSDTIPEKNWLKYLLLPFQNAAEVIGVEGRVIADDQFAYGIAGEGPTNLAGGVYLTCNCAYVKTALLAAGGFDENFPYAAYEDAELAARLKPLGQIVWQPDAVVVHPRRKITLRNRLKKLLHWQYALIIALRYGYIAWPQYQTNYPRLKVLLLSAIWLPATQSVTAFRQVLATPREACQQILYALVESVGAMLIVWPMILTGGYKSRLPRRHYLHEAYGD